MREGLPLVEGSGPPTASPMIGQQCRRGGRCCGWGRRRGCWRRKPAAFPRRNRERRAGVCARTADIVQPRQPRRSPGWACSRISAWRLHRWMRSMAGAATTARALVRMASPQRATAPIAATKTEDSGSRLEAEVRGLRGRAFPAHRSGRDHAGGEGRQMPDGPAGKAWRPGFWSCLAGFVEPGETFEQAAAREIFEEAGMRCTA